MRMSITRMVIDNFKGIRHLEIDFAEQTQISGMNGCGKSSIVDAFSWVLWNKDAAGNAPGSDAFREKPLDEDGREVHNLDTSVELICTLDGKPFNIKRLQRENWVKKRGSAQPTYSGNVSFYWINDVEVKQAEFKERIALIASEEIFRLIGSLSAFNALEWKKRRQQLINLSDTDVDGELLARDEYRPLADEVAQRGISIDDLRKVLTSQRKLKNDEIKTFPIRIDEARKALPTFGAHELDDARYIVTDTEKDIEKIDTAISDAMAQGSQAGLNSQILALKTELATAKNEVAYDHRTAIREIEGKVDNAKNRMLSVRRDMNSIEREIGRKQEELVKAETMRDALRKEYSAAYEAKFDESAVSTVCPTCGQVIPEERVHEALTNKRIAYDTERKSKLTEIKQKGIAVATSVKEIAEEIAVLEKNKEGLGIEENDLTKKIEQYKIELASKPQEPDYSVNPHIAELEAQIEQLAADAKASPETKIADLKKRKAELQQILERNRAILARKDAAVETEQRIKALEKAQSEAADQLGELETKIMLLEKFVMDRCAALEESINEKFPTVRWKLFDIQINGGITDTCICMIPCSSGLVSYDSANTAAKINADIEIVNVLSEHYGVNIPLFVDNSERVNRIAHTDSQLITLAVSGSDMKIEHNKEDM